MKTKKIRPRLVARQALFIMALLFAGAGNAKERKVAKTSPELYKEIAAQDSIMFAAYNRQDIGALKACFSTDLEWFQDNGGLLDYDTVVKNFEGILKREPKLNRQLVKGSLEVHPIKNYGAVETGIHQFRHTENGKEELGTFKFLMIWKKMEGNNWRVTRVVSYDH